MSFVGLLSLELHFPSIQSLKEKRSILRSIKDRIRKLNVGIAELNHQDLWQRATLGVVAIGQSKLNTEKALNSVVQEIDRHDPELIVVTTIDWL